MEIRNLPKELVSLIHYVELNRVGWWDEALQQIIMAVMWLSDDNNAEELMKTLNNEMSFNIELNKVKDAINCLHERGSLIKFNEQTYKLSEKTKKTLADNLCKSGELESSAKQSFEKCLEKQGIPPKDHWEDFCGRYLQPLIKNLGARVYSLFINEPSLEIDHMDSFTKFLKKNCSDYCDELRNAILDFLDPRNEVAKNYVLSLLNAHFVIESSSLSNESIRGIQRLTSSIPQFIVFLDTNLVFSILNIHDNPANEAAQKLVDLAEKLKGQVNLKFYVLPTTLQEARAVLENQLSSYDGLSISRGLAEVASTVEVSGVIKRYFQVSSAKKNKISFADYLDPYVNNLMSILKEKKIEVFQCNKIRDYKIKPKVIDDVELQKRYEIEKWGQSAKTYDTLVHDIVLWHYTNDKRPISDELSSSKYWISTIDHRLLSFDAYKKQTEHSLPLCIHPSTLVQLLQFWSPRDPELEATVYSSILPFFSNGLSQENEAVIVRILQKISRFEDIDDIPKNTIANILVDKSLQQKISLTTEEHVEDELIKQAFMTEIARIALENKQLQENLEYTKKEKMNFQDDLKSTEDRLEQTETNKRDIEKRHSDEIRNMAEKINILEDETRRLNAEQLERDKKEKITAFMIAIFVGYIVAVMATWGAITLLNRIFEEAYAFRIPALLISTFLYVNWAHGKMEKCEVMLETRIYSVTEIVKKCLLWVLLIPFGQIVLMIFLESRAFKFIISKITYFK